MQYVQCNVDFDRIYCVDSVICTSFLVRFDDTDSLDEQNCHVRLLCYTV